MAKRKPSKARATAAQIHRRQRTAAVKRSNRAVVLAAEAATHAARAAQVAAEAAKAVVEAEAVVAVDEAPPSQTPDPIS